MPLSPEQLWVRFQQRFTVFPPLGLSVDLSRVDYPDDLFSSMASPVQHAFTAMRELEKGGIANPDEHRMVGHYWLRRPELAPTPTIQTDIESTLRRITAFVEGVHSGTTRGAEGPFRNLLLIGIGGSALGPQFISHALAQPKSDRMRTFYFDNTDPDGMDLVLAKLEGELGRTLCLVISKSGGTPETRNGMLEAEAAYAKAGLKFNEHAVAITGSLSKLDEHAKKNGWLERFPMWDWVGGRTSVFSAVGLLPAALQGIDIHQFLQGARECDEVTRQPDIHQNPAAQLALVWHHLSQQRGLKEMVVLPYKDRLELFSRYLQQLVMESLGKELDLNGNTVHQGLTVYGNKGSTDQHAFVQQLRDGLPTFFVVFIRILRERQGELFFVEPGVTSGDYLQGFLLGTRRALYEKGRPSITLTLPDVSPFTVGSLIALFDRAVGFYASLINVNAYHQPGVQAGKDAAADVLAIQSRVLRFFQDHPGERLTSSQIASGIGAHADFETVFHICEYLSAHPERRIQKRGTGISATYMMA